MDSKKEIKSQIQKKLKEIAELELRLKEATKNEDSLIELEKENLQRSRTFNGLTARDWTLLSRSVWNDLSSSRSQKHLIHGATFPKKLADRIIKMYSKEGDLVFDPFSGTGTTLYAARDNNRKSIGIELNDDFYQHIESEIFLDSDLIKIYQGDCLNEIERVEDETIQLTFTSPPYADLLHKVREDREKRHKKSLIVNNNNSTSKPYSDSEADFGNMKLDLYFENIQKLMHKIYKKTKKNGYNIWVVKDFRDTINRVPFIDLHSLVAKAGEQAGFLYHDLIIWDQNEQRSLVLLGYPSVFYVNQNHSYIVVLRKSEWKK